MPTTTTRTTKKYNEIELRERANYVVKRSGHIISGRRGDSSGWLFNPSALDLGRWRAASAERGTRFLQARRDYSISSY